MIEVKAIELFKELIDNGNYYLLFDISILYQVEETLNSLELTISDDDFRRVASEVKYQYLKYSDVQLNDELVEQVLSELKIIEGSKTNEI